MPLSPFMLFVAAALAASPDPSDPADHALLSPVFTGFYSCVEHWHGQLGSLGDALGADCHPQQMQTVDGRTWLRSYRSDGLLNSDWFGWRQPVLSPIDGVVTRVNSNPTANTPGVMGTGMASFVIIARADGVSVLVAHVDEPTVTVGATVTAGQTIGVVGNNGQSRHPHIHLGAWKGETPLQIRFDQRSMATLQQAPPQSP